MTDFFMSTASLIKNELIQLEEEGYDISAYTNGLTSIGKNTSQAEFLSMYENFNTLEKRPGFLYIEPSDLEGIRNCLPSARSLHMQNRGDEDLKSHFLGAWLGRCAGCTLGKPVEGLTHDQIKTYLQAVDAYPLNDFIPLEENHPQQEFPISWEDTTKGNINTMPQDDDIDYTLIGLYIMEKFGPTFTTIDVGETWLDLLPYNKIFTAERVAYRNLVNEIPIPKTAIHHNPYREWIGAQIRADGFAYAAAGYPDIAAEFAFRDARLSHTKNGIYGEMFFAAMEASAFYVDDIDELIEIALGQIPENCRFSNMAHQVQQWHKDDSNWQTTWQHIEKEFGHYSLIHTINNAAIILASLLFGEGDLERTICISVMCGWDTDCNAATAGSIIGAMKGSDRLPGKWITPFNDTIHSAIMGFNNSKISELALRSWKTYQATKSFLER